MENAQFSSLALSQELLLVVEELGFKNMTPIQAQSIPALLEGKDLIGQSKTGSGKTAAFTLPILEKLDFQDKRVQALILSPTRELCTQVAREIRKLGRRYPGLGVLILSGGQPLYPQINTLAKGVHIVVGTPGRVIDHLQRETLDLRKISTLVLDEADRMLDMGFEEDMQRILKTTPKNRQTVFFSATFPNSIESMSRAHQTNPVRITIQDGEQAAPSIRQVYYEVSHEDKLKALLWLIPQKEAESSIVFCNQKATVVELAQALTQAGLSIGSLHGDLEQSARDRVMAKFRNHSIRILIATDVAARGIDVDSLDIVYNFDLPAQTDVYVHRIGRTGRAGKKGFAVSFVTPREKSKIQAIESYTKTKIEEKTIASLQKFEAESFADKPQATAKMATLYISGGRKEKMRPGDILGALTGEAGGLPGAEIGKIEIHDHFSYVAVSKEVAQLALTRLRNGRIKGRKFQIEAVR